MKKELFQSDQPILSNDLEKAQSSKEEAIRERLIDAFTEGIKRDSLNEFSFSVNTDTTKFDINTGVAYDKDGERILISDNNATFINPYISGTLLTSGDPLALDGTPNGPLTKTSDGIGGYTLTPQVSGCKAIPMASFSGYIGYVFIAYLQTTDPLVFTLQEITDKRLFTSANDGYQIAVVSSATLLLDPNTVNPDPNLFIYLGFVDYRAGGALTVGNLNTTGRTYFSLGNVQLLATTPNVGKTDRTLIYGPSQSVSVDEHIKAVGTGDVTYTNPHGVSIVDLGLTGKTSEEHERIFHTSGIIGDQVSLISSLYGEVNDVFGGATPPTFGIDTFKVYPLITNEVVNVNGVTITSADITSTNEFYFVDSLGNILPDGIYKLYVDNISKTLKIAVVPSSGTSVSNTSPATTTTLGNTLTLDINNDGAQQIIFTTNVTGAAVAADLEAKVRLLIAANPANQSAYDNFTAVYSGGLYTLTSGDYSSGSSSVVVSSGLGIAASLKLGVGNGGIESTGAGAGGTYRKTIGGGPLADFTTADSTTVFADINNFLLWTITFVGSAGPGVGNNNIPSTVDGRFFGSISSKDLVRDAATDTVLIDHDRLTIKNQVTLDEFGIEFPDTTRIETKPEGSTFHFASVNVGLSTSATVDFTVTLVSFTPNLPVGTTVVPYITAQLSDVEGSAGGNANAYNWADAQAAGSPYSGTIPATGSYKNVAINDKLSFSVLASGGNGSHRARWLITAIVH